MSDLWFFCRCGKRVDWPERVVRLVCRACKRAWIQTDFTGSLEDVAPQAGDPDLSPVAWNRLCEGQ